MSKILFIRWIKKTKKILNQNMVPPSWLIIFPTGTAIKHHEICILISINQQHWFKRWHYFTNDVWWTDESVDPAVSSSSMQFYDLSHQVILNQVAMNRVFKDLVDFWMHRDAIYRMSSCLSRLWPYLLRELHLCSWIR